MASTTPKISVIMPAYNTARLIPAALDSVLQQSFQDFEIIVVNDGSPDTPELEEVLAPLLQRIVYIKQENKRAAGARNTAIRRAQGEFLAFLDSDDSWLPDHLSLQMQLFAEDPTLGLVYSNGFAFSDPASTQTFTDRCPSQGPATFEALIMERCQIPISTVVVRKNAVEKAGLFDEALTRCDDYDMWIRTAFHGAKIGYSRRVQARMNEGRPGSLGTSDARMIEAYWRILEKAKLTLPLTGADRKVVEARATEIRARYLIAEGKLCLRAGRFSEAAAMFSQANRLLGSPKISAVLFALKIAPGVTSRLVDLAGRIQAKRVG